MPEFNGIEPVCPFDVTMYRQKRTEIEPDNRIDVLKILKEADVLYERNDPFGARDLLEDYYRTSLEYNDREGQLGMLCELLGCYRKTHDAERGIWAAFECRRLIADLGLEGTVTAGTVLLNVATTMKEFGRSAEAVPLYDTAARAYLNNLDPSDYRFAGLFNNYASCLEELGELQSAEEYYKRALTIVSKLPECKVEEAVTYVNLACLYESSDPVDERIDQCIRKAIAIFQSNEIKKDGYYAFNVLKCTDAFDHFGYFRDARELKKSSEEIYGILQNS